MVGVAFPKPTPKKPPLRDGQHRRRYIRGRIEAAHEGEKKPGLGMKSADSKSIALCRAHHRFWTGTVGHQGPFEGWSVEKRREWADRRGAESEARYLSAGSRRIG